MKNNLLSLGSVYKLLKILYFYNSLDKFKSYYSISPKGNILFTLVDIEKTYWQCTHTFLSNNIFFKCVLNDGWVLNNYFELVI